ncbi:MAG: DUF2384 domain-containing protein [Alphaproteobacteria bacterium]|nr:DUF2384 domain-containing protein [Alphaproteobacteria bacterium]
MLVKENARLIVRAVHVFRDVERAETWLKAPNALLQGETPLEALKTVGGAARVERQLNWYAGDRVKSDKTDHLRSA